MEGVVVYRHRQYIMTYCPVDMLNTQNKKIKLHIIENEGDLAFQYLQHRYK